MMYVVVGVSNVFVSVVPVCLGIIIIIIIITIIIIKHPCAIPHNMTSMRNVQEQANEMKA